MKKYSLLFTIKPLKRHPRIQYYKPLSLKIQCQTAFFPDGKNPWKNCCSAFFPKKPEEKN